MKIETYLPWPDKTLSPNARPHWSRLAKAKKAARQSTAWQLKAEGVGRIDADSAAVTVTFFPPDKRARDTDNMIASFKAMGDGIADVIGVDDSRWRMTFSRANPIPPGMVKVEIETGGAS